VALINANTPSKKIERCAILKRSYPDMSIASVHIHTQLAWTVQLLLRLPGRPALGSSSRSRRHGHPSGSTSVAVMNAGERLIMECLLESQAATMLQFIQGLRETVALTFEEGTSAGWVRDLSQTSCQAIRSLEMIWYRNSASDKRSLF
jgi:hypothetical protein